MRKALVAMSHTDRTVVREDVERLIRACEMVDEDDTGTLDAVREAATVPAVCALVERLERFYGALDGLRDACRDHLRDDVEGTSDEGWADDNEALANALRTADELLHEAKDRGR
jgi:hypothetical protein